MLKSKLLIKYLFFICLILQLIGCRDIGEGYRIKKDGVYRYYWNPIEVSSEPHEWLIKGADAKTFQVCSNSDWAKDKNRVYYKDNVIFDADPKTFESIDELYGKDSKYVFYYEPYTHSDRKISGIVSGADPNSFHKKKDNGYTDGKDIYHANYPMHVYDIKSFVKVDEFGNVYKDRKYYYLIPLTAVDGEISKRCPLLDYKTFHVLKEKNSILESSYMADKKAIYYINKQLLKADIKTFCVDGFDSAHDVNHVYKGDSIVAFSNKR